VLDIARFMLTEPFLPTSSTRRTVDMMRVVVPLVRMR
jgi:hypothetical protein